MKMLKKGREGEKQGKKSFIGIVTGVLHILLFDFINYKVRLQKADFI